MGIREMIDGGPTITTRDIEDVELRLDGHLPSPYRHFLLRHNGGRPEPPFFRHDVLSRFYSVKAPRKLNDLLANYRRMKSNLPAEVIAIADDECGNEICLAIKGKNRGKVYFWDHEGGTEQLDWEAILPELELKPYAEDEPRPSIKGDWPGHPDLTLIADSFTEFLESFHDEPELDDEPEDEPPEPEADDEPEDEPPGPPPEPAVWPLPGKPRKATSKAKGGSKATKAKPRAKKATKARSRNKG